jgi:hypothetical protein
LHFGKREIFLTEVIDRNLRKLPDGQITPRKSRKMLKKLEPAAISGYTFDGIGSR